LRGPEISHNVQVIFGRDGCCNANTGEFLQGDFCGFLHLSREVCLYSERPQDRTGEEIIPGTNWAFFGNPAKN